MTIDETILILTKCAMCGCEYHLINKCNKSLEQRDADFNEAIRMAVNALRKSNG